MIPPKAGTRWLLGIAILCAVAFLALAAAVRGDNSLTAFDRALAVHVHAYALEHPVLTSIFAGVTEFGSFGVLFGLMVVVALILLVRRRWRLMGYWLAAMCGIILLDIALKELLRRPRHVFEDPIVVEPTFSFPSGHTMGATIGYGLSAYLLLRAAPAGLPRITILVSTATLVLAVGASRIYLGVHYLSDVIGGLLFASAWLILWITLIRRADRRAGRVSDGRKLGEP